MVLDFAETRITPGAHLLACCLWREGRGVANVRLLQKPLQQFRQRFGRKRRGMRGGRRSQPNHPGSGGSTKVQTSDFTLSFWDEQAVAAHTCGFRTWRLPAGTGFCPWSQCCFCVPHRNETRLLGESHSRGRIARISTRHLADFCAVPDLLRTFLLGQADQTRQCLLWERMFLHFLIRILECWAAPRGCSKLHLPRMQLRCGTQSGESRFVRTVVIDKGNPILLTCKLVQQLPTWARTIWLIFFSWVETNT